jgi:probable HAF family extracellular repeat protein
MTPLLLPPGGNNGQAGPINAQGEILGTVENGTVDPECPPGISLNGITGPQLLHFEGVVWGPNGQISRELKPLPQDSVSTAVWMNDQGQAVGASGRCGNTALPPFAFGPHAVLWSKDGTPQDLGNLGYATQNIGLAVNNVGQVVGASATGPDSTPVNGVHAFYWTHETGMQDLGTLDGDLASGATGINDAGEVIGISIDPNGILSAVVWQNGTIHDLNELIPRSPLYLAFAASINNVGQIAGWGIHKGNGEMHAFVATPTLTASPASVNDGPLQRMPEGFEKLMRGRRGFRRQ